VALYARVSTNAQQTEHQLRRLHEVAALRGWSVVGEYVEIISGAAKDRPVFDKMMAAAGVEAPVALDPEDVARAIRFMLEQPDRANIARLALYPQGEGH
jgi:NADP-dependent 3-hydroxy acid dehydrogenase YdfG